MFLDPLGHDECARVVESLVERLEVISDFSVLAPRLSYLVGADTEVSLYILYECDILKINCSVLVNDLPKYATALVSCKLLLLVSFALVPFVCIELDECDENVGDESFNHEQWIVNPSCQKIVVNKGSLSAPRHSLKGERKTELGAFAFATAPQPYVAHVRI